MFEFESRDEIKRRLNFQMEIELECKMLETRFRHVLKKLFLKLFLSGFTKKNSFCESSSLFQLKVIPDKKVTNAKMFCRY